MTIVSYHYLQGSLALCKKEIELLKEKSPLPSTQVKHMNVHYASYCFNMTICQCLLRYVVHRLDDDSEAINPKVIKKIGEKDSTGFGTSAQLEP